MKKLLSIILAGVFTANLAACSPSVSHGELKLPTVYLDYYADGGLMAFGEYYYEFDNSGNLIEQVYYSGGYPDSRTETTYNSSGVRTEESVYGRGDKLETYREFDEDGNLYKETVYGYGGDVEEINCYNSDGLMVSKEAFEYSHYTVRYEYDEDGILVKQYEEDYDDNGEIYFVYEDTYDSEGTLLNRLITDASGNTSEYTTVQIEKEGNTRIINQYGDKGEVRYRTEEILDDDGNVLSKVTYVAYDNDRVLTREEFSYDDKGRVIDRIYDFMDVTEYKYEYADEGYMCKESIIKGQYVYPEVYGDGSGGVLCESLRVNYYDADGDKVRTEYYIDGRMTSYAVWEYEYINSRNVRGEVLDYRDEDRKLDHRATVVY